MIRFFLIALCLFAISARAQDRIEIQSIEQWEDSLISHKVILISAPWCTICAANKAMIEGSDELANSAQGAVQFYELSEDYREPIELMGKRFFYEPTGPKSGAHQLIQALVQLPEIEFPTYVFLNADNEVIQTYSGAISESSWIEIFGTILNQREAPDSESKI